MPRLAPTLVLLAVVGTTNALKVGVGDKQWPFMPPPMPMMPAATPQWGMPAAPPQWGMPAAPPQQAAAPQFGMPAAAPQFGMPAQFEKPKTTRCPEKSHDSCECLSWKEAFSTHNASCDFAKGLCWDMVEKLPDEKFCIGEVNPYMNRQWCYVSSNCASGKILHWGEQVGSNGCAIGAHWKTCGEGQDRILGDTKFEDYVAWTKTHDLDLGLLTPMAYDILDDHKLPEVLPFWGIDQPNASAAHPISPKLRSKLQKIVDSGRTTFIESPYGLPPYGVVEGSKFYFVNYADDVAETINKGEPMDAFAPSHRNEANCVIGCENVSPARWTVLNNCYPEAWCA